MSSTEVFFRTAVEDNRFCYKVYIDKPQLTFRMEKADRELDGAWEYQAVKESLVYSPNFCETYNSEDDLYQKYLSLINEDCFEFYTEVYYDGEDPLFSKEQFLQEIEPVSSNSFQTHTLSSEESKELKERAYSVLAEISELPEITLNEAGVELLIDDVTCFVIQMRENENREVTLGTSKRGGYPHLPKKMKIPKDCRFIAQFNMEELCEYDLFCNLPHRGMLYFFVHNKTAKGKIVFKDVSSEDLVIREYEGEVEEECGYLFKHAATIDPLYNELSLGVVEKVAAALSGVWKVDIEVIDANTESYFGGLVTNQESELDYAFKAPNILFKIPQDYDEWDWYVGAALWLFKNGELKQQHVLSWER